MNREEKTMNIRNLKYGERLVSTHPLGYGEVTIRTGFDGMYQQSYSYNGHYRESTINESYAQSLLDNNGYDWRLETK